MEIIDDRSTEQIEFGDVLPGECFFETDDEYGVLYLKLVSDDEYGANAVDLSTGEKFVIPIMCSIIPVRTVVTVKDNDKWEK